VRSLTDITCRWPIGDPKMEGFHFCGRAKPEGRPYCEHHAAIAFR
jgi:GcrA cell cycle regulator